LVFKDIFLIFKVLHIVIQILRTHWIQTIWWKVEWFILYYSL